jgi:hypothetical protein
VFSTGRVLVCFHFCFSLSNKTGIRISVGEISQAWWTHIRDLLPTRCTNIEQSNMQKDRTNGSREDWLNSWFSQAISNSTPSLQQWFVQCYPQPLKIFWNLTLNGLKMQNKCRSTSMQFYKPHFVQNSKSNIFITSLRYKLA